VVTTFLGRDYFRYSFGNHPFVVAKSWIDAVKKVEKLLEDPGARETQRGKVGAWYQTYSP